MTKPLTPAEAQAEFEQDTENLSLALSAGAGIVAPSGGHFERLMRAVESAPLRFAPFFSRTAALFSLPEARVEALFSEFDQQSAWRDSGIFGVEQLDVIAGKSLAETRGHFLRCAAGSRLPAHHHLGSESVLVLQGAYVDDQGTRHVAGEVHQMRAGTQHALTVAEDGCIIAVLVHGVEFLGARRPA
jgi:hypothetical protein